jgi:ABC-type Na+ efflux pump permease subunit
MRFGRPSLLGIVYLLVGVVVAANKDYFQSLETLERVVSALLAIVLWPLLFIGVDLHVNF